MPLSFALEFVVNYILIDHTLENEHGTFRLLDTLFLLLYIWIVSC